MSTSPCIQPFRHCASRRDGQPAEFYRSRSATEACLVTGTVKLGSWGHGVGSPIPPLATALVAIANGPLRKAPQPKTEAFLAASALSHGGANPAATVNRGIHNRAKP
jgi:hypothetical protein